MGHEKDISFSDYLNEEALQEEAPQQEAKKQEEATPYVTPQMPAAHPVDDEKMEEYWRQLRQYFRTGKRFSKADGVVRYPVLLEPYLQEGFESDYPIYLAEKGMGLRFPVEDLLRLSFDQCFEEGEAKILEENLPRIKSWMREAAEKGGAYSDFNKAKEAAFTHLRKLDVHGEEGKKFGEQVDRLAKELPDEGKMLSFGAQTPTYLLGNLLKTDFYEERSQFVKEAARLRSTLEDMLNVEKEKEAGGADPKGMEDSYDFAGDMLSFDKFSQFQPTSASEPMSKERIQRLNRVLKSLKKADQLLKQHAYVFIGKSIYEQKNCAWDEMLPQTQIEAVEDGQASRKAMAAFDKHIAAYVEIVKAARMARLETKDEFDEVVHTDFFQHFDWHNFTEDELTMMPPVILVEDAETLMSADLSGFSSLLASNRPVKVMALHRQLPFELNLNGEAASGAYSFRQELAAMAISHRSTYTLQATVDDPKHLMEGMETGLTTPTPALFHVLIPAFNRFFKENAFLKISAAVEGRQFPILTYDHNKGVQWGSRFDISANPQPTKLWPEYELTYQNADHEETTMMVPFTFADFFMIEPDNNKKLEAVAPEYWTDDLVPLAEFMELSTETMYAKVPFIWMVDTNHQLQKVVVPYSMVVYCQERLDFWNFIQELGGVNSFHVKNAVEQTREVMEAEKQQALADQQKEFEAELEQVRSEAGGEAMEKLANILLDLEDFEAAPTAKKAAPKPKPEKTETEEASAEEQEAEAPQEEEAEEDLEVSAEMWIETMRCTSCNDCTDQLPEVFEYNEEKQAVIKDPNGAPYPRIVEIAENCPAKCIHPGLPENPDDPEMEKWIKRAEPLN